MKGRKLSQLSFEILKTLIRGTVWTIEGLIETHDYDVFVRKRLYKQLHNLERSGYLEKSKDKNNVSFFHLTPRGKLRVLKHLHLEKLKIKKWDKRWRVIIFDIPEKLKKLRAFLRSELKNLGFEPLQESVYITPYPVTEDLDKLLRDWKLRRYCRYLSVDEIDGEPELKEKFGLK